jgi:xylulokinase
VIAWHDPRGEEAVARLQRELGDELDHRIGQRARTVLSAAKLGWLVEHGSCGGMATWLGVPELVLHALTGSAATEHSLAARTGCYDVGRLRWLPEVAELLGFSIDLFPDVRSAGDVMGRVSRAGTTWSGLPEGVAVTIAGHDHLVGSLGAGSTVRDFVNSVGTAETVVGRRSSVPDVPHAVGHGLAVTVFPGPAGWAVLASGARAGIVVSGAADALGGELAGLDHLAEAASRSVDAKEFVAALARGDEARVPDGAPGEVWRGVLEALVARTADAVERVMTSVASPDRLVVFGMGSRSRPWLRAKADALTVPVWRSTVSEAVARGAGLVAGVAAGWWPGPEGAPAPRLEQP